MKRDAAVCGLVFINLCVLNDKVDIYWIIRNGFGGRPGMVRAASIAGSLSALRSSTNVCTRDALERNEWSTALVRWSVDRTGWAWIFAPMP
jgi:hypothetical protein